MQGDLTTTEIMVISSSNAAANALDINATVGGVDIDAAGKLALDGAGGIDIGVLADQAIVVESSTLNVDASSAVTIDGTSTIGIGTDAAAGNISIGTNATARTITVGNEEGNTMLDLDAGTGGTDIDTEGKLALDGETGIDIGLSLIHI